MEQLTKEWFDQRKYKYTSSNIYKLLTQPKSKEAKEKGELGETAKTYVLEKIVEEMEGFIPEAENDATRWGNEHEPAAKLWYRHLTGNQIEDVGFLQVDEFYGGSPDSKVIEGDIFKGALEIKCPYNSINHFKHCLIDSEKYFKSKHPDYYWQCVSHMVTLGVNWCDFVSFDPRINHKVGFFLFRINRNEEDCKLILEAVEKANIHRKELKTRLNID